MSFFNKNIRAILPLFLTVFISTVFTGCSSSSTISNINASRSSQMAATENYSSVGGSMSNGAMSNASFTSEKQSSGERYAEIDENPFFETARAPLSTFSIDVDTASYANVRR